VVAAAAPDARSSCVLTAVSDHSGLSANRAEVLNAQSWRLIIVWLEVRVLPAPPIHIEITRFSSFIESCPGACPCPGDRLSGETCKTLIRAVALIGKKNNQHPWDLAGFAGMTVRRLETGPEKQRNTREPRSTTDLHQSQVQILPPRPKPNSHFWVTALGRSIAVCISASPQGGALHWGRARAGCGVHQQF
jgi:hypothetical protein